jgi:hypothetical protein
MSWVLRILRVTVLSALLASTLLLSATAVVANHNDQHTTGPQQIAPQACNEGTANARSHLASDSPARDAVPHFHTFSPGETHCYHANPTYPPQP